jgi:2-keto-3-deoxy-L-rhamnonate aldolase RhmA
MGGLGGGNPKRYAEVVKLGARFFSAGNDWALMMTAFEERVKMLRGLALD